MDRPRPRARLWPDLLQVSVIASVVLLGLMVCCVDSRADTLNETRAAHGLGPLRLDGALSAAAGAQAARLASQSSGRCSMGNLNHDGFSSTGAMAENIGCGATNATEAIQRWMRSPGHRRNILLRSAGSYGIGYARSSSGTMYWAMELGP